MQNQPGELLDVQGVSDPEVACQQNFEVLARRIWKMQPTYVNGAPNTVVGPPTTGTYVLDEVWIDSLGAHYCCTAAGTPGTWVQFRPAVVDTLPTNRPVGYWVSDRGAALPNKFRHKVWDGSAWQNV
ncbi:MAG TPA: hypothetical protein VNO52_08055 [Methylomirabilota bacterium]|nr:hypothetical protein [Methylomirabilota bacterium]